MPDGHDEETRLARECHEAIVGHFGDAPLAGLRSDARQERLTDILRLLGGIESFGRLRRLVEPRCTANAKDQCARLFGMGGCRPSCPEGCEGPYEIAVSLHLERELVDGLLSLSGRRDGALSVFVHDAEVRREWNKRRGLMQRLQPNTFVRNGAPTTYATHLIAALADTALEGMDVRHVHSWLSDIYDDACDMGVLIDHQEPNTPAGLAGARFGHMPERILRRRISDEKRREADRALPERWSLVDYQRGDEAQNPDRHRISVERVDEICRTLLGCLEIADNAMLADEDEIWIAFGDGELPEERMQQIEAMLEKAGKPHRRVVQDDGDVVLEVRIAAKDAPLLTLPERLRGIVLLDDFFKAWQHTRTTRLKEGREDIALLRADRLVSREYGIDPQ